MAGERFKDVEINGQKYRIGLVTALIADWIATVGAARSTEQGVYERVQRELLEVCSVYKSGNDGGEVPIKVFSADRFLSPELSYDADTVQDLIEAAFDFNILPLLEKRLARQKALKEQQTLNQ